LRALLDDPDARWDKPAITSIGPDKVSVCTEHWRYSKHPDGEELYDHHADPYEWTNLADKPEHAEAKASLARLLPKDPSRKQMVRYPDLPEAQRRLVEVPEGRFRKSDPSNYVPLRETVD